MSECCWFKTDRGLVLWRGERDLAMGVTELGGEERSDSEYICTTCSLVGVPEAGHGVCGVRKDPYPKVE